MTLQNIIELIRRKDLQDVAGDTPERLRHPRVQRYYKMYGEGYKPNCIHDDPQCVKEEVVR